MRSFRGTLLLTQALTCLCLAMTTLHAEEPRTPRALRLDPAPRPGEPLVLSGRDTTRQFLLTATMADGRMRDVTGDASWTITPANLARIDNNGRCYPQGEGDGVLVAHYGHLSTQMPISVRHQVHDLPVHFAHDIVPLFTKWGCNAGGCHGKADGQNGFRLSLLGFEPAEDYEFLLKESRGRRVHAPTPEDSLLLRKAAGLMPHGGGRKIEAQSAPYRLLRRWLEQGMPYGIPSAPQVTRIEVVPAVQLLDRGGRQQLVVLAHLSDGGSRDVTEMTQFESNAPDLAEVSAAGLVRARTLPGSAAVMARFGAYVDVFRVTVPLGVDVSQLPVSRTFVDDLVFARLKELGIPPSEECDESTFLRRATLDLAGRLPTLSEIEAYRGDSGTDRHERLIDRLLAGEGYGAVFANKWGAILRNRRRSAADDPAPTWAFHAWIRECFRTNMPYDRFVHAILTATGTTRDAPAVLWYREVRDVSQQVEDTAQLFLGQRLGCARCHHHPMERWSQADYHGLAAFFSRLEIKDPPPPRKPKANESPTPPEPFRVSHKPGPPRATHPRTGQVLRPAGLGGQALAVADTIDPRGSLAEWMTEPRNPYFAPALVNRVWKHFFGKGLVDPEDDLRITNPATHPALLDRLAREFIAHGYDLKWLIRTLTVSQCYRLSALPNAHNAEDRQNHSRFVPRRLSAEVLLDAVDTVSGARTPFKGAPPGARALTLPDNLFDSYFLSVFGRPDSASACECERGGDASLAQCLHMLNSREILDKVSGPRAAALARDRRPHAERIRELYLVALTREPSSEELSALVTHVERRGGQAAYEDVLWAILNTKEFQFNH